MNKLLNKIRKDNIEICTIDENKYKFKANIKFEHKNEEEDDDEGDNYENNSEDINKDINNINEDFNNINIDNEEEKEKERDDDCIICIKLYQCINSGYELNFIRKNGDIEDYYKYFNEIKKIIKQILKA